MTISIYVKDKTFRRNGESNQVLNQISITVSKGDFLTIIGPSGCGKSTLLKIIAGLDTDYEGEIRVHNRLIMGPGIEQGFIFQEHRLFPWLTVEENIAADLSLKDTEVRKRVDDLLKTVRLEDAAKAYPKELSGGMSQRVAIARALLRNPDVLLLDEPFGALDAFTRKHLQDVLLDIWKQKQTTMILVTHDIDEAVYLGNQLAIFNAHPGSLHTLLPISLSYPRDRSSLDFQHYRQKVVSEFEETDSPSFSEGLGI